MDRLNAIILMPDGRRDGSAPLFFENLLFRPLAAWVRDSLLRAGVEQFFLVCGKSCTEGAAACFPEGTPIVSADSDTPEIALHSFLARQPDRAYTLVITRPVYIRDDDIPALAAVPAGAAVRPLFRFDEDKRLSKSGINRIGSEVLMEELRSGGGFDLFRAIREAGEPLCEDSLPIGSGRDLHAAQEYAKLDVANRLIAQGVRFVDRSAACVCPDAKIGAGTLIMPGTVIMAGCEVGESCVLGPNTCLENVKIGRAARVRASFVTSAEVPEAAEIGPYANLRPAPPEPEPEPAAEHQPSKRKGKW